MALRHCRQSNLARRIVDVLRKERRTDELVMLLELKLKRNLMAQVAQLKLQCFGHVVRGRACELAVMVMEGAMGGTRCFKETVAG